VPQVWTAPFYNSDSAHHDALGEAGSSENLVVGLDLYTPDGEGAMSGRDYASSAPAGLLQNFKRAGEGSHPGQIDDAHLMCWAVCSMHCMRLVLMKVLPKQETGALSEKPNLPECFKHVRNVPGSTGRQPRSGH
jgi:hypothetical protein